MTVPTDAVVGALREAGVPSAAAGTELMRAFCVGETLDVAAARMADLASGVASAIAHDLPAILRATLPHWPEASKREVLRALLEERLTAMDDHSVQSFGHAVESFGWLRDGKDARGAANNLEHALWLLAPTSEETRDGE